MPEQHWYKHLDSDKGSNELIPMHVLAEIVCKSNYGLHRFLSHAIDIRNEQGRSDAANKIKKLIETDFI
jgi:hypothetical protein